jgi:hypothetical protein
MNRPQLVPLTQAAIAWKITRERLTRRVMTGAVEGEMRDGRWFVALPDQTTEAAA